MEQNGWGFASSDEEAATQDGGREVHSPRILVVDDEAVVCESCKRILEEENYEVECALNGREAFDKMKANPCDIVITDLKMPASMGWKSSAPFVRITLMR